MLWYWYPERCSTASRMVLLGMVPVLMAAPPITSIFSTSAARLPNLAAWIAARWPAGPDPITIMSYLSMLWLADGLPLSSLGGARIRQAQELHVRRCVLLEKLPACKILITD